MQSQHLPIFSLKQTPEHIGNTRLDGYEMAVATHTAALNSAPAKGLTSLVENGKTRFVRYRMYRQTVNELSALSNRELADLGLHRSMIRRVAMQAAEDFTRALSAERNTEIRPFLLPLGSVISGSISPPP